MLEAVGLSTHIYNNQIKSVLLLIGFPVLLLLMVASFCFGLDLLTQGAVPGHVRYNLSEAFMAAQYGVIHYGHYAVIGAFAWLVIAYFFHGSLMRLASGSRPVTRAEMPEIYNLLENLCIAQGMTMPRFEIIESPALNAFASGINEKTYCIVLTRGIIDRLDRDELEAVIGHELTHIINRDVRLLVISVIFVGMISFFCELAFRWAVDGRATRIRVEREGRGAGNLLVMLLAIGILLVGYLLALVIRFSLSRKREFLADAGSVEMTKNPDAMMRALLKISGHDRLRGMPDEVQQMCIENSHSFMGVFATHPPIMDRIRAISAMTNTPVPELPPEQAAQARAAAPAADPWRAAQAGPESASIQNGGQNSGEPDATGGSTPSSSRRNPWRQR